MREKLSIFGNGTVSCGHPKMTKWDYFRGRKGVVKRLFHFIYNSESSARVLRNIKKCGWEKIVECETHFYILLVL